MVLRLQFEPTETAANRIRRDEVALFQTQFPPTGIRWPTFFVSAGLHALVVLVVIPLAEILIPPDEPVWNIKSWGVASVLIRMPEERSVAPLPRVPGSEALAADRGGALARAPRMPDAGTSPPADEPKTSEPAPVEQASADPRNRRARARPFQVPVLPKPVPNRQALIQPQFLTNLGPQPSTRLPQMIFWSAERLPAPPRKAFVAPGRHEVSQSIPNLDAPPRLDPPNQEAANSDLKIAAKLVGRLPKLPRPPATTMPVRLLTPRAGASGTVAVDITLGDPINLIALSPNPAPAGLNDLLAISSASRGGSSRPPGPPGGDANRSSAGSRFGKDNIQAGGNAGVQSQANGAGAQAGNAASAGVTGPAGSGPGSGGTGAGQSSAAGAGNSSSGSGAVEIAGGRLPSAPPGIPSIATLSVPTRIVHPINGVFDIVIQTGSDEALPEATGALSGKPIYTVYLQVGAPKAWIMQYCLPRAVEHKPVQQAGVVYLGNPAPVRAPYPIVTITPALEWGEYTGYVMIRGLLDAKGKFQDLERWRGATKAMVEVIIDALGKWDFRPATQDGRPVAVQVLLVIPPGNV